MTSHKTKKQCVIENKTLLAQLPYYNCKVLTSAHPQFNSLIILMIIDLLENC